jgi:glycosyltransferase involved in cell wall biosynthesis
LRNVPLYRRLIRKVGPDVVVTHNWGMIEWAFAARFVPGLRHVHIEDGFGPEEANRQLRRRVLFRRLVLGGARTTVIVPSHVLRDIATRIWRLPPAKVQLVPNGIDLARFASADVAEARAAANKSADEVLIGTVATLRPEKNLGLLIRAFAALPAQPRARLFIVGAGAELDKLKATAGHAGVENRVVFFGHTPKPERIMPAFDVFAMSSDTEQMPIGLLEAMACGLPVAATRVGDIAHMVAAQNEAYLAPAGSVEALAGALRALVTDAGLRARLGAENLAKVGERYDQRVMFERYGALFG